MVDMDMADMVMVMARGLLMLSQDMAMVMDMELLLSMCPRLIMDMVITHNLTPTDITLDTDMVRGLLMLDMVMAMLPATPTEAHRDSMDTMVVMDMVVTDMVMVMARGLQMLVTMVVLALMSIRPVLTTMDLTDMVSTTTARGQLMLDILVMDMAMEAAATSKLTGHTLPMVSVLPTLTK